MKKLKPRTISDILVKAGTGHSSVISHCLTLKKLNQYLHDFLPAPLKNHCGVAGFHGTRITLYARSPAWSYKLRAHASAINQFMREQGIPVKKTRFIVVPPTPPDSEPATRILPSLSRSQKKIIEKAAESLQNQRLRKLLLDFVNKPARNDKT